MLKFKLGESEYNIANLYAPNNDSKAVDFLKKKWDWFLTKKVSMLQMTSLLVEIFIVC